MREWRMASSERGPPPLAIRHWPFAIRPASTHPLLPRFGRVVLTAVAVENGRAFVVGEHGEAAGVVVVVQLRALEPEAPQGAAERLLQVGLGEYLRRRAGGQHRPQEQHHPVAVVGHAAQVVGGHQHQPALGPQLAHERDDGLLGLHVDASERLVEKDHAALLGQGTGQEHPLLLAARQLADLTPAKARHPDSVERLGDLAPVLGRRNAQEAHVAVAAHHHHVLDQDGKVPVHLLALGHVGHQGAAKGGVDGQAADQHLALLRAQETHDGLEQGGLAATVDADEPADCAGPQFEVWCRAVRRYRWDR